MLLILFSANFTLITVAFPIELPYGLSITNQYIIEAFFYLDLFLNFFQGYKDPDTLKHVFDYSLIFKKYFFGWFFIDFVSVFPFSIFSSGDNSRTNITKLFRLARLGRLAKILDARRIKSIIKAIISDDD